MPTRRVTVVLFHDDEAGGYTAIMPMFPHCTTQGESVENALAMAKESLELNLQEPSDWDLFDLDHAYSEHVVVGTVEIDVPERPESTGADAEDPLETDSANGELSPSALNAILAQAGVTREEFDRLAAELPD